MNAHKQLLQLQPQHAGLHKAPIYQRTSVCAGIAWQTPLERVPDLERQRGCSVVLQASMGAHDSSKHI